ncbi:EamA family transporter RarD [Exiguobacterium antarcticum]|uniref:EamA family transporter RarD n=1 Tax=Exiguobacterium antarcticum TaxID=132920 RepID=UPI000285EF4F|nr:EamA family transporter RarD [Exiguobacterium antarcticum]AFS69905.1 RarD protein, DMT superfamily transporter [Exiguobacterium antarcticum B7]
MDKRGMSATFVAYVIGGLLPIYKLFADEVPAWTVVSIRIISAFVFVSLLLRMTKKFKHVKQLWKNRRQRNTVLAAGLVLGGNWTLYLYAIGEGYIVESSLGYYINPLVSVLFGLLFFGERLNRAQLLAMVSAISGVLILTFGYGKFPIIAFSLAVSFAFYGVLKKKAAAEPLSGLFLETLVTLPFALMTLGITGSNPMALPIEALFAIIMLGVATAIQLMLFGYGMPKIPFVYVGILQYIAPTLTLVLGVFLFNDIFTTIHLIAFLFIWLAVALFTISGISNGRIKMKKVS